MASGSFGLMVNDCLKALENAPDFSNFAKGLPILRAGHAAFCLNRGSTGSRCSNGTGGNGRRTLRDEMRQAATVRRLSNPRRFEPICGADRRTGERPVYLSRAAQAGLFAVRNL
jgi:hypothetical protein